MANILGDYAGWARWLDEVIVFNVYVRQYDFFLCSLLLCGSFRPALNNFVREFFHLLFRPKSNYFFYKICYLELFYDRLFILMPWFASIMFKYTKQQGQSYANFNHGRKILKKATILFRLRWSHCSIKSRKYRLTWYTTLSWWGKDGFVLRSALAW